MLPTTTLLERDAELAALRAAVDRATDGIGTVALIAGEAGIGKSALVERWLADEHDRARVLVGWCDDFVTGRTLGPLHDVARRTGGALAEAVERADISAVLDAVLALLSDPLNPVVLVLEDVHWADGATLDVVRYVGRRIAGCGAVMALTYRDDEVGPDHPLTAVLGVLSPTATSRVRPHPLSATAVAELVGGTGLDAHGVMAATAGNPFFVTEVMRSHPRALPPTVSDAVLARVRSLPGPTWRAVDLLSVLPRPLEPSVLNRLVPDLTVLAPAERRGLLVFLEDGRISFRHELARHAIEDAQTMADRRGNHALVLACLLAHDHHDTAAILHHAAAVDDADAIVTFGPPAAAEAMRAGAHRQAAAIHEQVLRHAHQLEPVQRAQVLEAHAWALYDLHHFVDAVERADQAVAVRRQLGEEGPLARSLCSSCRMRFMANEPMTALRDVDEAVEVARTAGDPEVALEAAVARATLHALLGDFAIAEAEAREALPQARRLGRGDLESLALNYIAVCSPRLDEEAVQLFTEAIEIARRGHHLEPAARAYTNLVATFVYWRQQARALRWIEEGIAFMTDFDFPSHRFNLIGARAHIHLEQGEWAQAEQGMTELLDVTDDPGVLEGIAVELLAR
ncbi:MAG TPA: AAA family ATPase, partial [Euzebya sp.]|nr:AAA family ATPase [Euzebya sp.]